MYIKCSCQAHNTANQLLDRYILFIHHSNRSIRLMNERMNERRTLIGAVPMVTMAQSAAKWRNTHTHMDYIYAFTDTLTSTQLQPCCAKRQLSYYFSVHATARSFRVSVIHRTRHGLQYLYRAYVVILMHACTHWGGHTDKSSQHFDSEKLSQFFLCFGWALNLWSLDLKSMLYQLSHPVTPF